MLLLREHSSSGLAGESSALFAASDVAEALNRFADAVYLTGGYPASMRVQLGDRLPTFTEEEKKLVLGSSDFYGMKYAPCETHIFRRRSLADLVGAATTPPIISSTRTRQQLSTTSKATSSTSTSLLSASRATWAGSKTCLRGSTSCSFGFGSATRLPFSLPSLSPFFLPLTLHADESFAGTASAAAERAFSPPRKPSTTTIV